LQIRIFSCRCVGCHRTSDFTKSRFELRWTQTSFQNCDELVEQRVVGFGEESVCFVCQNVGEVRLPRAATKTTLPHKSIALERCEMCADGVVGEIELLRQVFDSARHTAQECNDLTARALEKALIKRDRLHFLALRLRILACF